MDGVADLVGHRLGVAQDSERAIPARSLADRLLEAADRLEVVVEDVGTGIHHAPERSGLAVEVRDQDLDAHPRRGRPHLADRLGEDARPTVGQVVAGDAGHDDVLEAQSAERLGDPARLVVVEPGRPAGLDRAEATGPGAGVAQDHDRGGALVPALPDVGAAGLLADGVEAKAAEEPLEVVVVLAGRHPGPDPVRVTAHRGDRAAHRDGVRRDRSVVSARPGGREDRELASHGRSVLGWSSGPAAVSRPWSRARSPRARP